MEVAYLNASWYHSCKESAEEEKVLEPTNRRILMAHASARRVNEFLWEATTPEPFLAKAFGDDDAKFILCTLTGIQWQRQLPAVRRTVNVGAIGRPPNDAQPTVRYVLLTISAGRSG